MQTLQHVWGGRRGKQWLGPTFPGVTQWLMSQVVPTKHDLCHVFVSQKIVMYVLGKVFYLLRSLGNPEYQLAPTPEINQRNDTMTLRWPDCLIYFILNFFSPRTVALSLWKFCWSGTPWNTLWETQHHRPENSLPRGDLSELLHGEYLILGENEGYRK